MGATLASGLRPSVLSAAPRLHLITIRKFEFEPRRLEIRSGDQVEWTNQDLVPHTATDLERRWDSGEIGPRDRLTLSFQAPGHFEYYCAFHPQMKAELIVLGVGD